MYNIVSLLYAFNTKCNSRPIHADICFLLSNTMERTMPANRIFPSIWANMSLQKTKIMASLQLEPTHFQREFFLQSVFIGQFLLETLVTGRKYISVLQKFAKRISFSLVEGFKCTSLCRHCTYYARGTLVSHATNNTIVILLFGLFSFSCLVILKQIVFPLVRKSYSSSQNELFQKGQIKILQFEKELS